MTTDKPEMVKPPCRAAPSKASTLGGSTVHEVMSVGYGLNLLQAQEFIKGQPCSIRRAFNEVAAGESFFCLKWVMYQFTSCTSPVREDAAALPIAKTTAVGKSECGPAR